MSDYKEYVVASKMSQGTKYYKVPVPGNYITIQTNRGATEIEQIQWESNLLLATRYTLEAALAVLFTLNDKYRNRNFKVQKLDITISDVIIEVYNAN